MTYSVLVLPIPTTEQYTVINTYHFYDTHHGTTYWLEVIASGFVDRLDTPISVELYAVNVDVDDLVHAAEVAAEYGESVLFGYDAANARAALRRMDADAREGVEW